MSTIRATYVQHGSSAVPNITLNASGQGIVASGIVSSGTFAAPSGTAAAPGVYFVGDTNTGLYSPGADQVALSTNGTGRLFVDASGNVGVGNSSAFGVAANRTVLTVNGVNDSLITLGVGGLRKASLYHDGTNMIVGNDANGYQALYTNNTERLRITSAGLVGIGTSAPQQLLHVHNSSAADARLKISNGTTGSAQYDGLELNCASTGLAGIIQWEQQPIYFYTNNGSAVDPRLVITAAGSVGIGTTSPGGKLVISDGSTTFQFDPVGGTGNILRSLTAGGSRDALLFDASQYVYSNGATEYARIDSSGRLGIGTASPAAPLHTRLNSASGTVALFGLGGQTNNPTLVVNVDEAASTVTLRAGADTSTAQNLAFNTGTGERMRIDSTGNVLVGATSFPGAGSSTTGAALGPSGLISVHRAAATPCFFGRSNDGEVVALYSGTTQRGTISIAGATTTYTSFSDHRLKENVAPIGNATSRLAQLKPSRFNFIEFPEQEVDGFIAHEVQAVVPEAVVGTKDATDKDGKPLYQGLDQSKLVPLLTAALQEAIGEIESLKARVAALESA